MDINQARTECIEWQRHLAEQRRELEFQMERVKNAEAGLAAALKIWEGMRDSMIDQVRAS